MQVSQLSKPKWQPGVNPDLKQTIERIRFGELENLMLHLFYAISFEEGILLAKAIELGKYPTLLVELRNNFDCEGVRALIKEIQFRELPVELCINLINFDSDNLIIIKLSELIVSGVFPAKLKLKLGLNATPEHLKILANGFSNKNCFQELDLEVPYAEDIIRALSIENCLYKLTVTAFGGDALSEACAHAFVDAFNAGRCPAEFNIRFLCGSSKSVIISAKNCKTVDITFHRDMLQYNGFKVFVKALTSQPFDLSINVLSDRLADDSKALMQQMDTFNSEECFEVEFQKNKDIKDQVGILFLIEAFASGQCSFGLDIALSGNDLNDQDIALLSAVLAFGSCPEGLRIYLQGRKITDRGIKYLADALKTGKCPKGLKFYLQDNGLTVQGMRYLEEAFAFGNCPEELHFFLKMKYMHSEDIEIWIRILGSGKCPKGFNLHLNGGYFNQKLVMMLVEAVKIGRLERLKLCFQKSFFSYEAIKVLANVIASGSWPKEVSLEIQNHYFTDEKIILLTEAFESGNCPPGLIFHIQGLQITDKSVVALAKALKSGNCPPDLTIYLDQLITDEEIVILAKAFNFGSCPARLSIHIRCHSISHQTWMTLVLALRDDNLPPGFNMTLEISEISNHEQITKYINILLEMNKIRHDIFAYLAFLQGVYGKNQPQVYWKHLPYELTCFIGELLFCSTNLESKKSKEIVRESAEKIKKIYWKQEMALSVEYAISHGLFQVDMKRCLNQKNHNRLLDKTRAHPYNSGAIVASAATKGMHKRLF